MFSLLENFNPGGIRTMIFCSCGGSDDHASSPPGLKQETEAIQGFDTLLEPFSMKKESFGSGRVSIIQQQRLQCDQIRRIFASWAIVCFAQLLEKVKKSPNFLLPFYRSKI
jgi:hypothetical protein